MSENDDEADKPLLPPHMAREQEALGMILSLISRSLAILVAGVAAYLGYLTWQ